MKMDHTIKELLGDRSILIVEPSINYRNSIKGFLTNLKISEYRFVSGVRDAQIALLTMNVGLFICEWKLKGTNGIQFCRDVKRNRSYLETPFMLLSVENLKKDVILASEVGIDGYLLKPFSFEEFQESLRITVRARKAPSKLNIIVNEGYLKIEDGLLDDAEQKFQKALEINPLSARAFCGLARIALEHGNVKKAVSLYKSALEVNPDYVEGIRSLLELCLESQSVDEWLPLAWKAHQMSPENPKYTIMLARGLLEKHHFSESEQFFKKTIRLSPRLAEAYKGLGKLYLIQEDYDSAMKNFSKALDLDDSDVSLLNSLGMTYVKMGKYREGMDKYLSALQLEPHDHRILFNLGYAQEKIGDLEKAKFYYHQALNHNPEFVKARRRLAQLD